MCNCERKRMRLLVERDWNEEHTHMAHIGLDVTRFNRHLLRSKLNWSDSHEESEIPGRIQG